MPVTPEQAISAAMRGVMRTLHVEPPQATLESYQDFLRYSHEMGFAAGESIMGALVARQGKNAREIKMATEYSYLRALSLAVTSLLALAHHPHLAEIDKALPRERLES